MSSLLTDFIDTEVADTQENIELELIEHDHQGNVKPSIWKKLSLLALKLLICGCMVFLVSGVILGIISGFVIYDSIHIEENGYILFTSEYQIDLPHSDAWLDREEEMVVWMQTFEEQCKYFDLSQSEVSTATRLQYYYDIKSKSHCNYDAEIRVRDYLDESHTTVDVKGNSKGKKEAYELPYSPSYNYFSNSTQKCEHDFHSDSSEKYSRETRINLAYEYTLDNINTCSDITTLFHDIKFDEKYAMNPITTKNQYYWLVREYTGYLDEDTKYKIAFTLQYSHLRDLESGSVPPSSNSEWSIRIYGLEDGVTDTYNKNVVAEVESAWEYMIENLA